MKAILEFVRAAAPWVAAGILVVILAVRAGTGEKKAKKRDGDCGTEGMCLGMCFGAALGTALGGNTGIGLSLGMLAGLAIGSCIPKKRADADE